MLRIIGGGRESVAHEQRGRKSECQTCGSTTEVGAEHVHSVDSRGAE